MKQGEGHRRLDSTRGHPYIV